MAKKKTFKTFEAELKDTVRFNAEIVFWYGIIYERYARGNIDYATAINTVKSMEVYNGV